jgi:nucleoside-diphosphate-sugar epimerase
MRVVVSGATGFLGGKLCRHLFEAGHAVIGLGRDVEKGRRLEQGGIRFFCCDLGVAPEPRLPGLIGIADAFVHAAGLSSAWGSRGDFMLANVTGTRHAVALARAAGVGRFVFISSPSVCFRFADQVDVREDEPFPKPVNAYAWSKQIAEGEVLAAPDLSPLVLRPRAIYGPGDTALLPRLVRAAGSGALPLLRGGKARTNLTYIDDVVRAIELALAASAQLAGRVFNIAGEAQPVCSIAERAAAKVGIMVKWRPLPWPLAFGAARIAETVARLSPGSPEPRITAYGLGILAFTQTLDVSAARRQLGFEAGVSFEQGLSRTFDPEHRV